MATKFAADWKKAGKTYETAIAALARTLTGIGKTDIKQADGILTLLLAVDRAKLYFDVLAAIGEFEKSPLPAAAIKACDGVTRQINDATAAAAKAAKGPKKAWADGTDAAEVYKQALNTIVTAIAAHKKALLAGAGPKQSVAFVKLLPANVTGPYKKIVNTAALGQYVVQVEMALPKPVLDALAQGVEGVSLAKMQDLADKAVAPFRAQALFELEFIKLNLADFPQFAGGIETKLAKFTTDAATAAAAAVDAHWAQLEAARKEVKAMNKKAVKTFALGALSLAASVTTAVLSFGTAIPAYFSMAKTAASIASTIAVLAKSADSAAEDVMERVLDLRLEFEEKVDPSKRAQAREVLNILGVPFMKGCAAAEAAISVLSAKTVGLGDEAQELLAQVNEGLALLKEAEKIPDAKKKAEIAKLSKLSATLLDRIGALAKDQIDYMDLAKSSSGTIAALKEAKFSKFSGLARKVDAAKTASDIYGVASNILTVASALV
jgi:hypothetical protein